MYGSFVREDGPVQADGVVVSLNKQRCGFDEAWTWPDQKHGALDLWMRLTVRNDSNQMVTVDPRRLRLIDQTSFDDPVVVGEARQITPAHTENVDVRFHEHGDAGCSIPRSLSLDNFVHMGDRQVLLRSVSFVPET